MRLISVGKWASGNWPVDEEDRPWFCRARQQGTLTGKAGGKSRPALAETKLMPSRKEGRWVGLHTPHSSSLNHQRWISTPSLEEYSARVGPPLTWGQGQEEGRCGFHPFPTLVIFRGLINTWSVFADLLSSHTKCKLQEDSPLLVYCFILNPQGLELCLVTAGFHSVVVESIKGQRDFLTHIFKVILYSYTALCLGCGHL